jgi:hypothetical protein
MHKKIAMPKYSYNYCALQFLNQWLGREESYCESLGSYDTETQRQGLVAAGGYFKVARNLPTKHDVENGLLRYQPVLDIINSIDTINEDNVVDIVNSTKSLISEKYGGRNVLSLTSKFLWLKFKSPVRIYDSQARIALDTSDNYSEFYSAFTARLTKSQDEINQACLNLVDALQYSINPSLDKRLALSLVTTAWFKERVLDMCLWNEGNA